MKTLVFASFLVLLTLKAQAFPQNAAKAPPDLAVPGEFLVKCKPGVQIQAIEDLPVDISVRYPSIGAYLVKTNGELAPAALARHLRKSGLFSYVEPNYIYQATLTVAQGTPTPSGTHTRRPRSSSFTVGQPNDPEFSKQYGLANSGQTGGKTGADINALQAWEIQKGSPGIVVAVIDTGIDYKHPDLKDNIWSNPGEAGLDSSGRDKATNGVDDDNNGLVDDIRGWDFANGDADPMDDNLHGTHVAGIIGANANNSIGITGVAWRVSLMPLKFLKSNGAGTLSDALQAIEYAIAKKAHILNNSWGGGGFSQALLDLIGRAYYQNALFVAAAGNEGRNNDDKVVYPAGYDVPNVIAVGSSDSNDQLSQTSNFGVRSVDLLAPGSDIFSTTPAGYELLSGTSGATAFTSGVAALVLSQFPNMHVYSLRIRLLGGIHRIPALDGKIYTAGRLDAKASLESDTTAPAPVENLAIKKTDLKTITLTFSASGDDAVQGGAAGYLIRYATTEILSEEDWKKATPVLFTPFPKLPGEIEVVEAPNLTPGTQYYFAVKVYDNASNVSGISNITAAKTRSEGQVFFDDMENTSALWATTGDWAITTERATSGTHAWSDSPTAYYKNNASYQLSSRPFTIEPGQTAVISYKHAYDFEKGNDYGVFEISTDAGATWKPIKHYTGLTQGFQAESIDVSTELLQTDSFAFRFRVQSDRSISRDGWYIDDVKVITSKVNDGA